MKTLGISLIAVATICCATAFGQASIRDDFKILTQLVDSAKILEADVFAPQAWKKADAEHAKARVAWQGGKNEKTVRSHMSSATEYTEIAVRASEVARLSLEQYLPPRAKARAAQAFMRAPDLYLNAEDQFKKATAKVESGNVKAGLAEAAKAVPLFEQAEMEAILDEILGAADKLIAKAQADEAEKYALSTFDRARTARTKAATILAQDRYNRTESVAEAEAAAYEAQHASNMANSVRALERNDQAWEKLMLVYEIQMNRVGRAIGLEHLPFDDGPLAAADTLIAYIQQTQGDRLEMKRASAELSQSVRDQLRETLARIGRENADDDPVELAHRLDEAVAALVLERDGLAQQAQSSEVELAQVSREHEELSEALSTRVAKEEKFKEAKMLLNPSEGEVLFNSANDIVLRLWGLSFGVGKSDIVDDHIPLLDKVIRVIKMFPDAELVVEGHTDASGDPAMNMQLSEKRAFAVMMYLRQSLLIPADRIRAIGFGAERPVASNKTAEGRAKNRRNDILIMQ